MPPPFPWGPVIHAGLCLLRLSAKDFWLMTPREIQAALGGLRPAGTVPDRFGMEALMAAFPD
ncbi:rcc01693 family protein [Rhizobium herbae]